MAAAARLLHQAPAVTPTAAEILRNVAAQARSNWMILMGRREKGWGVVLWWCAPLRRRRGGGVYRLGRGRELGFPERGRGGKFMGTAALLLTLGRGDGSWVTRFLRMRCGTLADLGND
jgi:hypothetical protein